MNNTDTGANNENIIVVKGLINEEIRPLKQDMTEKHDSFKEDIKDYISNAEKFNTRFREEVDRSIKRQDDSITSFRSEFVDFKRENKEFLNEFKTDINSKLDKQDNSIEAFRSENRELINDLKSGFERNFKVTTDLNTSMFSQIRFLVGSILAVTLGFLSVIIKQFFF